MDDPPNHAPIIARRTPRRWVLLFAVWFVGLLVWLIYLGLAVLLLVKFFSTEPD
ncbi:MAG TPA: hypothetical protein VHD56_17830 [Tepidisphaeraceae bacterium]|nr:hypothetical protein [Tepidisphaeraceae bacterium]